MLDFDCTRYSTSSNEGIRALKERTYFDLLLNKNEADTYFMYPYVDSTKFNFHPWQYWESGTFKNNVSEYAFFMSGDCTKFFEKRKFQNLSTRCILYYSEFESKKTIHEFIEIIPYLSEIDTCLCGTVSILEKIKLLAPSLKAKLILKPFFDSIYQDTAYSKKESPSTPDKVPIVIPNKLIIHMKHLLSEELSFTPLIQQLNNTFSNETLEIIVDAIDTCSEKNETWLKETLSSIKNTLKVTLKSSVNASLNTPISKQDRKTEESRNIFSSNHMRIKTESLNKLISDTYSHDKSTTCSLLSLSGTGDENSVNRVLYSLSKHIQCYTPDIIDYENLNTINIPISYSHEDSLGTSFISSEKKWKESIETNYSIDIEFFVKTLEQRLSKKDTNNEKQKNRPTLSKTSWPEYLNDIISKQVLSKHTIQSILKDEKTETTMFNQSENIVKIYKDAYRSQKKRELTLTKKGTTSLKTNKFSNIFGFELVNIDTCKKILKNISENKSFITECEENSLTSDIKDINATQYLLKYEYLALGD
jgi:hypothetical protein